MMHIGHVALRVTDLDRAVDHVQTALGLRERQRTDREVLLSSNEKHHELQLIAAGAAGLDHIGLEVESDDELEAVRDRAVAAGARLIDDVPAEEGIGRAIRFVGPADMVYEVYDGMHREALTRHTHLRTGVRRFGHLTFFCEDPPPIVAFWRDGLGLRISDRAGDLTFMRCDADHHGLAVGLRPQGNVLHHHGWEVQDLGALGQYCDDIARARLTLSWGPVRHGPGFNIATYLPEPDGSIIEVYTDMIQIQDERAYQPIDWSADPEAALVLWGPMPDEALRVAGVPVLGPVDEMSPVSSAGGADGGE